MKKSERKRFLKLIHVLLMNLGATHDGYEYTLYTRVGTLRLRPCENTIGGPGTVFGRFADPKAAFGLVGCNRCSGKWNFHFFSEEPDAVDAAVRQVESALLFAIGTRAPGRLTRK